MLVVRVYTFEISMFTKYFSNLGHAISVESVLSPFIRDISKYNMYLLSRPSGNDNKKSKTQVKTVVIWVIW